MFIMYLSIFYSNNFTAFCLHIFLDEYLPLLCDSFPGDVVSVGVKDFFNDTKMYLRVTSDLWAGRRLDSFSRIELDNYRQVG